MSGPIVVKDTVLVYCRYEEGKNVLVLLNMSIRTSKNISLFRDFGTLLYSFGEVLQFDEYVALSCLSGMIILNDSSTKYNLQDLK